MTFNAAPTDRRQRPSSRAPLHQGSGRQHATTPPRRPLNRIVERGDGRVVAIEVKLARTVGAADVRHLTWRAARLGDGLLGAVVATTGGEAYRRADGIAGVPAALLGP